MIDHSGEDQPVLGDPPTPPDDVWARALDHALDPWAAPDASLVPSEDLTPSADDAAADQAGAPHDGPDDDVPAEHADHLAPDAPHETDAHADDDAAPTTGPDAEPHTNGTLG